MKVLIAEDDPVVRAKLEGLLPGWNYEPVVATNGLEAWEHLRSDAAPELALVDWQMPDLTGDELCRKVRAELPDRPLYLILMTATRLTKDDAVAGLSAGADDYVVKPFHTQELRARLRVGERTLELQNELRQRVKELERALAEVKELSGLLPICSYCKRIRDDKDYWHQVERYFTDRTGAKFTHGICPACAENFLAELEAKQERPTDND